MVVLLHSCKNCMHCNSCDMREDYNKLVDDNKKLVETYDSDIACSVNVYVRCNMFHTNYGKNEGYME